MAYSEIHQENPGKSAGHCSRAPKGTHQMRWCQNHVQVDSSGQILLSTREGTSIGWYSSIEATKKLLTPGLSALQHTGIVRQDVDLVRRKVLEDLLHKTNLTLLEQISFSSVTGNVTVWEGETKRVLTQKRDSFCSEYWSPRSRKKLSGSHNQFF